MLPRQLVSRPLYSANIIGIHDNDIQSLLQCFIICVCSSCAGIDKAGVFSVQANLSRLRAQLTVQANKRYIYACIWYSVSLSRICMHF